MVHNVNLMLRKSNIVCNIINIQTCFIFDDEHGVSILMNCILIRNLEVKTVDKKIKFVLFTLLLIKLYVRLFQKYFSGITYSNILIKIKHKNLT